MSYEILKLDLGSGPSPLEGWLGVDRCEPRAGAPVKRFDFASGVRWPFLDGSVTALRAHHVIEHLPADEIAIDVPPGAALRTQDALFRFFDEAYRVALPGAKFELWWPNPLAPQAFQDPTHRRFLSAPFLTYLSILGRDALGVSHYDVACDWQTVQTDFRFANAGSGVPVLPIEIHAMLRKPGPWMTPNA